MQGGPLPKQRVQSALLAATVVTAGNAAAPVSLIPAAAR